MDDTQQVMDDSRVGAEKAYVEDTSELAEPVLETLAKFGEVQRYRFIASLLGELADRVRAGGSAVSPEQIEALKKKIQALGEEKATLDDSLATTRADLARREKQLEAEDARASELQRVLNEQRERLKSVQKEHADREAELVAKNAELHRVQVENENLALKLQRAQRDASGRDRIESLEQSNAQLNERMAGFGAELDQLRAQKDLEIERLKADLAKTRSGASKGADEMLLGLWQRLAGAKPPLAEGHIQPEPGAPERLVDAFIELVQFADDFDKAMRVFLGKYTKHQASVKVPWDVYAKRDDVVQTARQTVSAKGGRPVGLLKMRLRFLYAWSQAAMVGCDSAIESLASELQSFMMGPVGAGSDPNRKVKEFLRDDGHELFLQHIRELRSQKLAESYGRGG